MPEALVPAADLAALGAALVLGLGAALAPGPLTALVVQETLRQGPRGGILVALAPLVTDIHALVAGLWLVGHFSDLDPFLAAVGIAGAAFLILLAVAAWRTQPLDLEATDDPGGPRRAFVRGLTVNALNPNLYLFWFTVGATQFHTSLRAGGWSTAALFLFALYVFFIGAKMLLAVLVGRSRRWVTGARYVWANRLLGIGMGLLAIRFAWDAAARLGLLA